MAERRISNSARRRGLLFLIAMAVIVGYMLWLSMKPPARKETSQPYVRLCQVMGTYASLSLWTDEATGAEAARRVFAVFDDVDAQFSNYKPESELSRLNASAVQEPFACSDRMWELLTAARQAYKISDGGFDISAGPLMKLWGFYKRRAELPAPDEITEVLEAVGLDRVVFDDTARTVFFTRDGVMLDLGGIAKGYAIDLAIAAVRDLGVDSGVIDLGGNLYCLSIPPPDRLLYNVGIRNPRDAEGILGTVPVRDAAVAGSGDYERFVDIGERRICHIMDPRTGQPTEGMAHVSVVASTAMNADILSTAAFVSHGKNLEALKTLDAQAQFLIISIEKDGSLSLQKHGGVWDEIELFEAVVPD
jgi:thiamine biosynthesis lipoprotein